MTTSSNDFPQQGFVRLSQIKSVVPVSDSTWWEWCRLGKAPKPIKLSEKVTVWHAHEIHKFIDSFSKPNDAVEKVATGGAI